MPCQDAKAFARLSKGRSGPLVRLDQLQEVVAEVSEAEPQLFGLGLTQEEAAARLDVTKGSISRAENNESGRFLRLQRRIIEELADWKLKRPLREVERFTEE